jgi:GAF domain-containing protein
MDALEPIAPTAEAFDELDPVGDDAALAEQLTALSRRVLRVVPECVGLSVASTEAGVTFTLVSTDSEIARLDGVQYLAGGPCVDVAEGEVQGRVLEFTQQDLLDEGDWQLFARATAARGIASTLTLPVMAHGEVTGTINLYGSTSDAFHGHHEELAAIFSAWAPGAVANADLSFHTRDVAARAPEILREAAKVETVVGMIAAAEGVEIARARDILHQAAQRAGVAEVDIAATVLAFTDEEDAE